MVEENTPSVKEEMDAERRRLEDEADEQGIAADGMPLMEQEFPAGDNQGNEPSALETPVDPDLEISDELLQDARDATDHVRLDSNLFDENYREIQEKSLVEPESTCPHEKINRRREGWVVIDEASTTSLIPNHTGTFFVRQTQELCVKCREVFKDWENVYIQSSSPMTLADAQLGWEPEDVEKMKNDGFIWKTI